MAALFCALYADSCCIDFVDVFVKR